MNKILSYVTTAGCVCIIDLQLMLPDNLTRLENLFEDFLGMFPLPYITVIDICKAR